MLKRAPVAGEMAGADAQAFIVGGPVMMMMKDRKLPPEAAARWTRRSEALEAGAILISNKPDRAEWTDVESRLFRYAMAITRRMEKLQ